MFSHKRSAYCTIKESLKTKRKRKQRIVTTSDTSGEEKLCRWFYNENYKLPVITYRWKAVKQSSILLIPTFHEEYRANERTIRDSSWENVAAQVEEILHRAYTNIFLARIEQGMRCGSMSGKHTLKIDVPAGGTRKTPPHPSWTISSLSLSLVRASTFGKRMVVRRVCWYW